MSTGELVLTGPDGHALAVDRRGADGPALVVAHGVGSSARFVTAAFAEAVRRDLGLTLVAYDLRGHGRSGDERDPVAHALDRHVADLDVVVRATGAVAVGGVSLGGHVAAAYAADGGPVEAVVACLPAWTGRAVPGEGPHAATAADVDRRGVAEMTAALAADPTLPGWLRDTLVTDWSAQDPASLAAALRALDGGLAPTEGELRGLGVPLAVVGWPDDPGHPLAVARDWAGWAPRGALGVASMAAMQDDLAHLGSVAAGTLRQVWTPPPSG
jgi:pimeloyl-ACP methyl ester carboxylesterase